MSLFQSPVEVRVHIYFKRNYTFRTVNDYEDSKNIGWANLFPNGPKLPEMQRIKRKYKADLFKNFP